ncbi:MAG: four helix bundle protein [Dehalococcoidia bacterium]|nr:MAG: four helix bundle protein [Dehalococcoidia bacterium]
MLDDAKKPIRGYKDLRVYQRSMDLLAPIHQLVLTFPEYERFALADQMRRASRSVPTNIVESYSRRSSAKEFKHFLGISMGSANEMVVHLEITRRLGYATYETCATFVEEYDAIGRQIHMLIARWRSDGRPPTSNL